MRFPSRFVVIVAGREFAVYGLYLAVTLKRGRVDRRPSRLSKWNTALLSVCVVLTLPGSGHSWPLWLIVSLTAAVTGVESIDIPGTR